MREKLQIVDHVIPNTIGAWCEIFGDDDDLPYVVPVLAWRLTMGRVVDQDAVLYDSMVDPNASRYELSPILPPGDEVTDNDAYCLVWRMGNGAGDMVWSFPFDTAFTNQAEARKHGQLRARELVDEQRQVAAERERERIARKAEAEAKA